MAETLHRRIRAAIEDPIRSGAWPPGHRIPFEHELARDFACSRMTVNKALSALAAEGLIARRRGIGSVVAAPGDRAMLEIEDIAEAARRAGRAYRHEVVARHISHATASERSRLGLDRAARLLRLVTLHVTDGVPEALERRVINLAAAPLAEAESFAAAPPGSWLLRQVRWTAAEHAVRAVAADRELAERLGLARGAPCLVLERRTWLDGAFVTEASIVHPGDRHRFVGRFGPGSGPAPGPLPSWAGSAAAAGTGPGKG